MPTAVSKAQVLSILREMGYQALVDTEEIALLLDPNAPGRPVGFDFSRGPLSWDDVKETLENEGINSDAFYSHFEAMG